MPVKDASTEHPATPDRSSFFAGFIRAIGHTLGVLLACAAGLLASSIFGMNDAIAMILFAWLFPFLLMGIAVLTRLSLQKRGRHRETRGFVVTTSVIAMALILAATLFSWLLFAIGQGLKGAAG
ncbi:hypothetical protein [Dyella silvatica]|uniref:hypothetical protein n=1 Tax=Dyella silvatica TaxID=2992128 RepID=UPI00224DB80B|nr:hypothetical protein [Dyella silvatica]